METKTLWSWLLVVCVSVNCLAATWEGTDNFTSGISTNWTVNQSANGTMTVGAANDHASYLVAAASTSQQEADLFWKGTPSVAQDWTADITGHNAANYSGNGTSQLQLWVIDMSALKGIRLAMARDGSGQVFNTKNESGVLRQSVATTNTNFGLRLVYHAGAQLIEAWCDSSGVGTNRSKLDTINLATFSSGMALTDTFTIAVIANAYYGPISEGQLYADNFRLTNATPPVITNQPISQASLTGASVSFSVGVSGSTPLFYQWFSDGGKITNAIYSTLILTNLSTNATGSYFVVVSNAFGTVTSSNVVLTVNIPSAPAISGQPQNQTTMAGQNISFNVTASGTLPLYYQWKKNESQLTGMTGSSLILANLGTNDAGTYSVVVSNLFGSMVSSNAVLTVQNNTNFMYQGLVAYYSTNLSTTNWNTLNNVTLQSNPFTWSDPTSNSPSRYYRVVWPYANVP